MLLHWSCFLHWISFMPTDGLTGSGRGIRGKSFHKFILKQG